MKFLFDTSTSLAGWILGWDYKYSSRYHFVITCSVLQLLWLSVYESFVQLALAMFYIPEKEKRKNKEKGGKQGVNLGGKWVQTTPKS